MTPVAHFPIRESSTRTCLWDSEVWLNLPFLLILVSVNKIWEIFYGDAIKQIWYCVAVTKDDTPSSQVWSKPLNQPVIQWKLYMANRKCEISSCRFRFRSFHPAWEVCLIIWIELMAILLSMYKKMVRSFLLQKLSLYHHSSKLGPYAWTVDPIGLITLRSLAS